MKILKQILVVFILAIYLISSSGYMVYKSHCSCMGTPQVSVFVSPKTCESEFHQHHKHDQHGDETACTQHECHDCAAYTDETACSGHECHDCVSHTKECGCSTPEALFFKLKNQAADDDVKFVKIQALELFVANFDVLVHLLDESENHSTQTFYNDPPPVLNTSLEFLIQIQQLKIPNIA